MKRRTSMPPQRYQRTGLLAVDPKAFLELFIVPSSRENELVGDVCVVDVCGPLDTYDSGWGDSYESIKRRIAQACESSARAVVLRMDSPGGDCAGCFDTALAVRAMCRAASKPLYAHCEHACSAGYALASAADYIAASSTGTIGSIGVLQTRPDYSAANAAEGVRFEFIASGTRKAYGHVDAPITDAEIKDTQQIVDYVGGVFCALVEQTRGIPAADVAALQAGVFHAEAAMRAGLVDEVSSFEALLARIASGERLTMSGKKTPYQEARATLEELAKGDDANAASARRALAVMDESVVDDDDDEDKPADEVAASTASTADDDDDDEDDDKAAASDDDKKAAAPEDKKAAAAPDDDKKASAHSLALKALAEVHELKAERAVEKTETERKRLLDSRPDFAAELRTELMKASTPIATVRSMVKTLKRGPVAKDTKAAAAAGTAAGTRGASQGASAGSDPRSADALSLDAKMGLTATTLGVRRQGNALLFGVTEKPLTAAASGSKEGAK